ncbi:MAG: flagellar motor switch protein FliG [Rectinemataceae bacterium]
MRDRLNSAYKGAKSAAGPAPKDGAGTPGRKTSPEPAKPAPASARGPAARPAPGPAAKRKAIAQPGRNKPSAARALSAIDQAEAKASVFLKTGDDPGVIKAAKFLLLLGAEEASQVLAHLSQEEIEAVSREILGIKSIDAIEANDILAEFGWLVKTKGYTIEGGPETAERMLTAAFGRDRAQALLRRASPDSLRPFRFLNDFEPKELQLILKEESPQVMAVIIPYIDPKRASGLIERLSEELRIDIVKRIARIEKVSPDILRRIEEGLKDRIRKIGTITTEEVDGKAALANILRHVDTRMEGRVLEALDEENPELSKSVREFLFTLEDVVRVANRDLQKALRDFQDKDLALILKGRSDEFRDKLLSNVSTNRRELILDEYRVLGAVRRDDADEAARSLLVYLKKAWDVGDIVLEGEEEMVE